MKEQVDLQGVAGAAGAGEGETAGEQQFRSPAPATWTYEQRSMSVPRYRQRVPLANRVDERSTAELVAAAREGDQDAWTEIVERYAGLVWSVTRAHRMSPAEAADVYQTTWLRLVENLSKLREPDHLGGWLSSTTRHECLRLIRGHKREFLDDTVGDSYEVASQAPAPDAGILAAEQQGEVLAAFRQLSQRCRDLLSMLMHDPAPAYDEVSERMEMPVGSIGPTRGRCLGHLRRILEEVGR